MSLQVVAVLGRGVVDVDTPVATADDLGLTRGDGCFEGVRLRRTTTGAEVHKLELNLARMTRSASALDIPFDEPAWRELVEQAVVAWAERTDDPEAAGKLVLTRGRPGAPDAPTGYLTVTAVEDRVARQRRDGITVVTLARGTALDAYADAPWLLGGVKTLSYVVNMAALREAARRGADDALYVSSDGWVLESPGASVVWSVDGVLHTVAPGDSGILGSTTLQLLFARAAEGGIPTVATTARVSDLRAADAVVSVSSVRGPVRVTALDGELLPVTASGDAVLARCRELTDFPG